MTYFSRARILVLALFFGNLVASRVLALGVSCDSSLSFNNLLPGRNATKSITCYETGLPTYTSATSTLVVYLSGLPSVGGNSLPANSIAISPNNASFTSFTGTGTGNEVTVCSNCAPPTSSSPQTIWVRVTAPSGQPAGQYVGGLQVGVTLDYTP